MRTWLSSRVSHFALMICALMSIYGQPVCEKSDSTPPMTMLPKHRTFSFAFSKLAELKLGCQPWSWPLTKSKKDPKWCLLKEPAPKREPPPRWGSERGVPGSEVDGNPEAHGLCGSRGGCLGHHPGHHLLVCPAGQPKHQDCGKWLQWPPGRFLPARHLKVTFRNTGSYHF